MATVLGDVKEVNGGKKLPLVTRDSEKVDNEADAEEYSESKSLLPPRRGGMSRKSDKTPRNVQWKDKNGNKLAEVLEFEPSWMLLGWMRGSFSSAVT
ncbi:Acidic leucine-rich nuclear phosphoprotein 32-related protein 2 [Melia azedarach]|uniref:Acidic leucine-rich nuclear phosphoprotein 32-related protein 2 n=1 Tax=Melia azedarach TaxID=155640 RepID=A0ACC1YG66_MELAZ|nr:Acidic leucine-rich nuclear phosphoprotein 32-related protein 2 [Melia azedarach]